jgi:hypothetical protein
MVDVKKRRLEWQENLELAKPPAEREHQYGPVEITTSPRQYEISADLAAQINTELANYNRHRNALSLWNVLTICIENKIPIPDKVSGFFLDVSQKLIGYARDGKKGASPLIARLVLGTVDDDGGGASALRSFRNMEKERDIVRRTNEIIFQDITQRIAGKSRTYKSLEAIYSTVANELCVESKQVQRVFRLYEKDTGSFGLRELLEAATSSPQVFASGLDTTPARPDEVHSEDPSD